MKMEILLPLLLMAGCVTVPLTPEEQAVRIYRKSDPPTTCKELGKVYSGGLAALTDEGRENNLKRAARKAGGNAVSMDRTDENNTIYGTAWNCPRL